MRPNSNRSRIKNIRGRQETQLSRLTREFGLSQAAASLLWENSLWPETIGCDETVDSLREQYGGKARHWREILEKRAKRCEREE